MAEHCGCSTSDIAIQAFARDDERKKNVEPRGVFEGKNYENKEQLNKQLSENHEKDLVELMIKCLLIDERDLDKLSPTDLDDLEEKIEKKMMGKNSRVNGNSKKKVILDGDEAQSNPAP
ncbi:hypothetical protein M9H77_28167 [Catharanthus roseus]|uniref:Uncharacterized protein n=1 Tax=Catharanthus roseus TaxID=4058 RepID=A0ACC0AFI6_CATRO|nr:hypothetical protein M9H77_28167 [Catharanthus roseus]